MGVRKITEDFEEKLRKLEKVTPTEKMLKYGYKTGAITKAYEQRLFLIKKVGEMKSAHRKIIFGDCPDELV